MARTDQYRSDFIIFSDRDLDRLKAGRIVKMDGYVPYAFVSEEGYKKFKELWDEDDEDDEQYIIKNDILKGESL